MRIRRSRSTGLDYLSDGVYSTFKMDACTWDEMADEKNNFLVEGCLRKRTCNDAIIQKARFGVFIPGISGPLSTCSTTEGRGGACRHLDRVASAIIE
ncbi:hypothetical protein ANTQUA_LOCUS8719 [Anthophora quadrimaculata]